jgi:glycosyltransferase involved in cell wall biosynthesis
MSAGLAMIVTDVGGNAEAVIDEETGFVVAPRNPKAISEAMLRLARDPALRRRLGDAARKRVEETFSIDRCVKAHAELYEDLLQKSEEARIAAE